MHFFVSGMVWEKTVPLHRRPETCKQNGGRNTGAGVQDPEKKRVCWMLIMWHLIVFLFTTIILYNEVFALFSLTMKLYEERISSLGIDIHVLQSKDIGALFFGNFC